ncbi:MAG TPA: D-alanyl-D-alanine carboxypeptidase family protein [Candidatus Dormibacteraeota bacterium]|jgi:D-alanyl-D-alanine carboxypeptidase (penicillin-binding protein 5/6)|nr:D-alanyl-D-alanine carboxypeptidase family protein [Candidatus Dormibacteraeota bacterium]
MAIWLLLLAMLVPLAPSLPNTGTASPVQVYVRAAPATPSIKARAALVIDLDAKSDVFQLNAHARLAPASLTKIVTALVALDAMRLDQLVTVPASINQLPWDSTRMGLKVGERLTVRELLYGLFLNSGNDAAITLAEAVTSRATFVDRMNRQAAALGMADTHFVNPIGLDDPAHFTSAADLARAATLLTSRYPEVASLASTARITLAATATHHAYALYNLNDLLRSYPGTTGLKTGWTGHAGGCLIATATRGGRHLMVVVLGSPRVFQEASALLDYGFDLV